MQDLSSQIKSYALCLSIEALQMFAAVGRSPSRAELHDLPLVDRSVPPLAKCGLQSYFRSVGWNAFDVSAP